MLDHVQLFAEDQARYVITARPDVAERLLKGTIPVERIGEVTASPHLATGQTALTMAAIRHAHEAWFPAFMAS